MMCKSINLAFLLFRGEAGVPSWMEGVMPHLMPFSPPPLSPSRRQRETEVEDQPGEIPFAIAKNQRMYDPASVAFILICQPPSAVFPSLSRLRLGAFVVYPTSCCPREWTSCLRSTSRSSSSCRTTCPVSEGRRPSASSRKSWGRPSPSSSTSSTPRRSPPPVWGR